MMVELGVNRDQGQPGFPGFTKTALNGYEGTQSVEEGSREVVRVALLGPDGPTGTFALGKCQFLGDAGFPPAAALVARILMLCRIA